MNGMGQGSFVLTNPTVVALFHHLLLVVDLGYIIFFAFVLVGAAAVTKHLFSFNLSEVGLGESGQRAYLRFAFGGLWLIDGLLQFQPSMPLGLANQVIRPSAEGAPGWLDSLVRLGVGVWNNHPVAFAAGVTWLQIGIGLGIIVSNGRLSRLLGGVSAVYAFGIWVLGNSMGGVFQSTSSLLFGWPGATLFYCAAGVWLALGNDYFERQFSKVTLRVLSALFLVGAVLQTLPSRGFWSGGNNNALVKMAHSMTQTAQPQWLATTVKSAGDLAGRMGGGFNIIVVTWMLLCAWGLWVSFARQWRWPVLVAAIGSILFWVVAQDTALFGGLATDVNSLPPLALLLLCASPRLVHAPPLDRRLSVEMRSLTGSVLAAFALSMVTISLLAMSLAPFSANETSWFLAANGQPAPANGAAFHFSLTDQFGHPYHLGEHPGFTTVITALDPRCNTDCPLMADQILQARALLSGGAKVDFVAVAADPYHEKVSDLRQFINTHGLRGVANFYFVTGSLSALKSVWLNYGIAVSMKRTDRMSIHSDYFYFVDPALRLKWVVADNPLASWAGQHSGAQEIVQLLRGMGVE